MTKDVKPPRPRCNKRVFRKPQFTGFPPMARDCHNDAVYQTMFGPRCTRHTDHAERLKANRIPARSEGI